MREIDYREKYVLIYLIKYIILNNLGIDNPFILKYFMKLQRKNYNFKN